MATKFIGTIPGFYRVICVLWAPLGGREGRWFIVTSNVFSGPHSSQIWALRTNWEDLPIDKRFKEVSNGVGKGAETIWLTRLGKTIYGVMEHGETRWVLKKPKESFKYGTKYGERWAIVAERLFGGVGSIVNGDFKAGGQLNPNSGWSGQSAYFGDPPRIINGRSQTIGYFKGNWFAHGMAVRPRTGYPNGQNLMDIYAAASFCENPNHFGIHTINKQVYKGDVGEMAWVGDKLYTVSGGTSTMYGPRNNVELKRFTPGDNGDLDQTGEWILPSKRGTRIRRSGNGMFISTAQPIRQFLFSPEHMSSPLQIYEKPDVDMAHDHRSFGVDADINPVTGELGMAYTHNNKGRFFLIDSKNYI